MKFDIITLFPNMFKEVLNTSMLRKAQQEDLMSFNLINLRDFGLGAHKQVDDAPYGGGDGMVLKPEPVFAAVESIKQQKEQTGESMGKIIILSPQGETYKQAKARQFSQEEHLVLICGRYEGFDQRIFTLADEAVSLGNYVLTGGEIPAMAVIDSVTRLLPGVLGGATSAADESFSEEAVIEYPHYTRPEEYRGMKVPEVLLSGNHQKIAEWRKNQRKRQ